MCVLKCGTMKCLVLILSTLICLCCCPVCVYGGGTNCDNVLDVVGPCFQTLEQRMNSTLLSAYNWTYDRALNETTGNFNYTQYFTLAARDEVCKASNEATIACLLTNMNSCPDVTIDTSQFLFTDYVVDALKTQNTTAALCSYYRTKGCDARTNIFTDCYGAYLPRVQVGNEVPMTLQVLCQEHLRPQMNCMLESYKECDDVLYLDLFLYDNIPGEMINNQWSLFDDAGDICACTIKTGAQRATDGVLANYAFRLTLESVALEYDKVIRYAESLCVIQTTVTESFTVFAPPCNRTSGAQRMATYKRYYEFTQLVCTDINSPKFKENRACIIDRLVTELTPCYNVIPRSSRNLSCKEINQVYFCFTFALENFCGEEFIRTLFEVFRDFYGFSKSCEITSSGSDIRSSRANIGLLLLFAILCIIRIN